MRRLQNATLALADALHRRRPLTARAVQEAEALCGPAELHPEAALVDPGAGRRAFLIVSGWAAEQQTLADGRRQILRLLAPGDFAGVCEPTAATELQALSAVTVADVTALRSAVRTGQADSTLAEAWRQLEYAQQAGDLRHLVRLGRLSALERTGQLLLELYERLTFAGLTHGATMPMPLTQIQLADHLGLSVVHVNRVLQRLRREGYIEMRSGQVVLRQPAALAAISFHEIGAGPSAVQVQPPMRLSGVGLSA